MCMFCAQKIVDKDVYVVDGDDKMELDTLHYVRVISGLNTRLLNQTRRCCFNEAI